MSRDASTVASSAGRAPRTAQVDAAAEARPLGRVFDAHAVLAEQAIVLLVRALEQRPDIAADLRRLLGIDKLTTGTEDGSARFMSVREYAGYARVSERTLRGYLRQGMTEGVHFHRDGRTGRRVIFHVAEADSWRASRTFITSSKRPLHELATNDIARRRAKAALRKVGVRE